MSIYWELLMVVEGDWRFRGKERVSYTQGMISYPPNLDQMAHGNQSL